MINVKGLDQLVKALKARPPITRVGILGGDNAREGGGPTNSEVGAAHEFGAPARGIPQRSFLRVPISENLEKYMKESGAFKKEVFKNVIKDGSVKPWMETVAANAETVVKDAFDTGGFGKWPAWKDPGYVNNSNMLLVDTGQLRKSITSEVKDV